MIPLPPLDEQRRIAAWLAGIKAGAASIHSAALDHKASVVRESLFLAMSDRVEMMALGSLLANSRDLVEPLADVAYQTIGIKSFGKGLIRYAPKLGSELSKLRYYHFPPNALAVSNIQAWEGALGMTEADELEPIASNRFFFYVPQEGVDIDPRFVLSYLLTVDGARQVREASPGSTMRNKTLSLALFETIPVPFPDHSHQAVVVDSLAVLDRALARREAAMHKVDALLPSALNQVFRSLT